MPRVTRLEASPSLTCPPVIIPNPITPFQHKNSPVSYRNPDNISRISLNYVALSDIPSNIHINLQPEILNLTIPKLKPLTKYMPPHGS